MSITTTAAKGSIPFAVIRGGRKSDGKEFFISETPGGATSIDVLDGQLSVLPGSKRTVQYIFGMAGSGKSTWIGNYVAEWLSKNPGRPVIVISRKKEDDAFHGIPCKYLIVDQSLLEEPLSIDDLPDDCMTIWDDIDSIQPKKVNDAVQDFLRDVLEVGRSRNINAVVSSHLGSDYKRTRTILNETHGITFFPWGSSAHQIKYVLKTYGGMDAKAIQTCLKLPSRWIHLRKSYPPAIVFASGAYLLNAAE